MLQLFQTHSILSNLNITSVYNILFFYYFPIIRKRRFQFIWCVKQKLRVQHNIQTPTTDWHKTLSRFSFIAYIYIHFQYENKMFFFFLIFIFHTNKITIANKSIRVTLSFNIHNSRINNPNGEKWSHYKFRNRQTF